MRIAIFGSGGVGGYFGGRLAESGEDVTFVARGRQLDALSNSGLTVESLAGDFVLSDVAATDDPASVGHVDAVLVATKAWQVSDVARAVVPMVGPSTVVVPLQNGVEAAGELERVLGPGPVLGGLTRIISYLVEPGRIRHAGMDPIIVFGERSGGNCSRCAPLAEALARANGVSVEVVPDIEVEVWKKFAFICAWSGVGAVTRMPLGAIRSLPGSRSLLVRSMEEIVAVGGAHGVELPDGLVAGVMSFIDGLPEGSTASMQRDIEEGKPSELDHQNGAVVRLGGERGVETPVNGFIYDALQPAEQAARDRVDA